MPASLTHSTAVSNPPAVSASCTPPHAQVKVRTLLYVGQNPAAGTGSPIIVLRHLKRFAADGWKVVVVGEYGGNYDECIAAGWTVIYPVRRRWWWPPYREKLSASRWLRLRLLASDIVAQAPAPDVIFGYLAAHSAFSAELAVQISRHSRVPLHFLAHDDAAAFPYAKGREAELRREHGRILSAAAFSWFVSPELAACFPNTSGNGRLLYPIPEGWSEPAQWHGELAHRSAVYYAGHLWPEQLPLMTRVARSVAAADGELVLMARQTEAVREFCLTEPARWQPQFPTNREALAHLAAEAAAVLVSYADTIDDMPWCATSFPSKLVEYCHLGIPVAIVAHADSSVAKWARRVGFPYCFEPKDLQSFQGWVAGLRQKELWEERAGLSLKFARSEFDPNRIQARLANAMTAGTERRSA